jgi:exodeoxyribonuclease V alpha subunit
VGAHGAQRTPLLDALWRSGALRTLDHALAQSLRRLDPDTPDTVLAAAALASLAVASGHAGFDPADPRRLVDAPIDWPTPEAWREALQSSCWVAHPETGDTQSTPDAPLVYEHGLVYLRRYREYERRLAAGLHRIGLWHLPPFTGEDARRAEGGTPAHPSDDLQSQAITAAQNHPLLLITGGPGTGKTTTITRLLLALIAQAAAANTPSPRIALAAPTGRAAERMAESVRNAVQTLPALGIDPALAARLPTTGTTLHRLLGTIPDSPAFRHHADNPLPFDVVVVDEASMIDLPLMAKLVEAVPDGARLVLLGDPDQLPSVEAGDVLAGILSAANTPPVGAAHGRDHTTSAPPTVAATPDARHPREGGDPWTLDASAPTETADTPALSFRAQRGISSFPAHHIHLTRNYRQSATLDLAPLATAVRQGDTATALSLLRSGRLSGVHFHENNTDPLQSHRDHLLAHWTALADTRDPAEALARAGALRVLTAVREGPQGARGLNARIEDLLVGTRRGAGPASTAGRHFHGRLLLITENSYRHRLFNGDIGICLRDDGGTLMAWFPGDDPRNPRPFHPAALPAHDSAFAMTVHKAQGSEFDAVWLVLPERSNRVLSRELVYTGITRARSDLHLAASEATLREALSRHTGRWSGLGWRLGTP